MRRKSTLWLFVVIALLAIAFYLWGSSNTPLGQPPLVALNRANLLDFQQSFNAAAAESRIVLLLSPT
jgi:hypothetical protein